MPHISGIGRKALQTAGRSGLPKIAQRWSSVSWMQRTPAGFPFGMPGMGEEIEGAMQHAPQPTRQSMWSRIRARYRYAGSTTSSHS